MKSFNKNSNKYNYSELAPIEIYELIRSGKIKKFPNNFWECDESNEYTPELTRYLIEKILNWNDEDIKKKLRKFTFRENGLGGLLCSKYRDSAFEAISKAYPEKNFGAWDFVNAPNDYWQGEKGKENAIFATKWLIEDKLKWSENEIIKNLNHDVFIENNLLGMLKKAFNSTLFEAINSAYPNRFKEWELRHVPRKFWSSNENCINATKWLIEEKLQIDIPTAKQKLSKKDFKDNNLISLYGKHPVVELIEMLEERRTT